MQAAGIDRQQHVGRGVFALADQALDQLVGAGLDHVHLDSGFLGELLEQHRVGIVVAMRIDVQLSSRDRAANRPRAKDDFKKIS